MLPQSVFNTDSVPMFYMFVQSDGRQPTSSARMMEDVQESQQSANDDNTHIPRPPLYTHWNLDSGMLEVRRGHRVPTLDGTYVTRTWTESPSDTNMVKYEGTVMVTSVDRRWSITHGLDSLNLNTLQSLVLP